MQIGRFTPYEQLAASGLAGGGQPGPAVAVSGAARHEEGAIVGTVPPAPTEEARALVDRAADRVDELHRANRELHFKQDETTNRIVIEVRDLDGNVLKTIPPAKALEIMSGADF
ncbi:MAG TPA: flagellar protein FlaG [Solirubrobacter sp.]|nr:flagellar protein FlaG [Solirubrobacter sp.]